METQYTTRQYVSTEKDEWLTPPYIIEALGFFDLDPCAPIKRPWDMARNHYTIRDNGLNQPWVGRVWCHPPYGQGSYSWFERCAEHANCIALTYARTDTRLFDDIVWQKAVGIFFLKGRLKYHYPNGERGSNSANPSVLIAFDEANARVLEQCGLPGKMIWLNQ